MDWESGLPNLDDLPPLSHLLISPELGSAFNITPEPHRSMADVTLASHKTLLTLSNINSISSSDEREDEMVVEGEEAVHLTPADSGSRVDDYSTRTSKRIRLVWTPQLHKRFVEVVKHLGMTKAVPKTIMQMMNVEGLTRENVASHLQKYRLYVKRTPPDRPVSMSRDQNRRARVPNSGPYMVPMTYSSPHMVHHHGFEYRSHPYKFGLVSPYKQGMTSHEK